MKTNGTIGNGSLLCEALVDAWEAAQARALYEEDGQVYTDFEDLWYEEERFDDLQNNLETAADVLSVYAEEATRFSPGPVL